MVKVYNDNEIIDIIVEIQMNKVEYNYIKNKVIKLNPNLNEKKYRAELKKLSSIELVTLLDEID